MAEQKKFLDSSGISHLWDRIEERYPNVDELEIIINAIDEVKADKSDVEAIYNMIAGADEAIEDLLELNIIDIAREDNVVFTDNDGKILFN